jgi:hypothetical protein
MVKKKGGDYEPNHSDAILKKKIKYLEEELVRKEALIEKLKKENALLFNTALKRSEEKVDSARGMRGSK